MEANSLAVNGFGDLSPGGYPMIAGFIAEFVLTFMFLMIIMGATDRRAPQGFAPIAIGLGLTLIHLIGIPVTNVSVNPARSLFFWSGYFCGWTSPGSSVAIFCCADPGCAGSWLSLQLFV
jgi:glycerol uptake facilitator-like aquaporin